MVRLAIAGTGGMADYQAKKFAQVKGCVLVACKDHKHEQGVAFAARHGISQCFDDIEKLLDAGVCDALSCAVLDGRHRGICEPSIARCIPVLCEKPLARSLADCQSMVDAVTVAGVPNMINFSKRNAPALVVLRDLVKSGMLGQIHAIEATYLQGWVLSKVWGDWRTIPRWRWRMIPESSTEGVVGDLGSHIVDSLLFVFGDLTVEKPGVSTSLSDIVSDGLLSMGDVPPEFFGSPKPVCVEFSGSARVFNTVQATIKASWIDVSSVDDFKIIVRGTKMDAHLDLKKSRDSIETLDNSTGMIKTVQGKPVVSTYECFISLAESWLKEKNITVNETCFPDFAHGLRVQRILDRLVEGGLPE